MLKAAYKNSLHILGAFNEEGKLVGVLRAVGDGASILFIQDILVYPEYPSSGDWHKIVTTNVRKVQECVSNSASN